MFRVAHVLVSVFKSILSEKQFRSRPKAITGGRSLTHLELSKFCIIIQTRRAQNAPFPSIALVGNSLCANRGHPFQLFTEDCDIMFRSNKWAIYPNQTEVAHRQGQFVILSSLVELMCVQFGILR